MKIYRKEKGVSEVLGSILILLITVVLFSSVFYYVSTMPTPKSQIYAQFDASLQLVNVSKNGQYYTYANITVKNMGGESLVDWRTMFIVVIDFTAKQHMLSWINISKQPFDKDGKFSQGESFYYNSSWDNLTVNPYSDISVSLYDKSNGKVIWSAHLKGRANLPPVLISLTSSPSPIILNKRATLRAIIFDPDNPDVSQYKVGIDLSILSNSILTSENPNIENPSYISLRYTGGSSFQSPSIYFKDLASLDVGRPYKIRVWIDDLHGTNVSYSTYLFLSRGTGVSGPDLFIDPTMITLSNPNPTHMDDVTVTVTIQNFGGTGARFQLRVYDIYKGYLGKNGYTTDAILISTNFGSSASLPAPNKNYSVAAAGQSTISFIWKNVGTDDEGNTFTHIAGIHQLRIEIINITPEEDSNAKYPNQAIVNVTVMPRILLVDDDRAPEGSTLDTGRYYRYILDTCSYSYDLKKGEGGISKEVLEEYDIVIWETGYAIDPIPPNQAVTLNQFYNDGGAIWISSQNIDSTILGKILGTGVNIMQEDYTGTIKGVSGAAIDLTLNNGSQVSDVLINRDNAENGNTTVSFNSIPLEFNPFLQDDTGRAVGIYSSNSMDGKIVYTGFEISRIKHYYHQNFIAFRILKWLGNLSGRTGNDLAIEDMTIEPENPLYKEPVKITVIVSNNGGEPLSSEVLLKIDGITSLDINTTNPNSTGVIPPNGGFVKVNFTWIPSLPGKHIITAIVDPYNVIKETNEENNVVNSEIIDTEVYVHFSTLVIYNSTSLETETEATIQALNALEYKHTILNLYNGAPPGYDDGSYFSRYNLVIWTTSNIGDRDINAIENSMTNYGTTGHFFLGSSITKKISETDLSTFLGLSISSLPLPSSGVIFGINNERSITNGLAFITAQTESYTLTGSNAQGLFRTPVLSTTTDYLSLENALSQYSSTIPFSGIGIAGLSPSKFIVLPIDLQNIKGIFGLKNSSIALPYNGAYQLQARALLMYRLLRYFGYQDLSPELATYPSDIQIIYGGENPSLPPIVGRSYMLRTTIYNHGAAGASAVVRFYDDFEWIGSQSVYLPPANVTNDGTVIPSTAKIEIVWTPMFAGNRHIRVVVDPLNEVKETPFNVTQYSGKEIFNFNNEAIITKTIYYFWDDMENGAENWMHEATVMNINGESPLDFVNRKDVSTNVIGDWDWELSGDTDSTGAYNQDENVYYSNDSKVTNFTADAYHSASSAFWMPEAPRISKRKPIDVIFVIDTSGSMDAEVEGADVGDVNEDRNPNTRLDVAIQAALNAISLLGDNDRVAIFTFDRYSNPKLSLEFTYVNQQNLPTIETTLKDLRARGGTPLYDTFSWAVYYMDQNSADNPNRQDATRGILVLTDGLSNSDDKTGGQYIYAPGNGDYEVEDGVIHNYLKDEESGLLKVPYNLLTISIAPNGWDGRLFPIGNSSTGNISMAIFEDDPNAIQGVFTTFIVLLSQASTGGLRAISPFHLDSRNNKLGASNTIHGLGAVVFSDGFRDTSWSSPGFDSTWTQSDFTIASTGDRHKYYKDQSGGWQDKYWVAETSTPGAYLEHMIYPTEVLKKHYVGNYEIKGAEIRFWVGRKAYTYPIAEINVYAKGTLLTQSPLEFKGSYQKVEQYYNVTIPASVYSSTSPYNIKIEISNLSGGTIAIDDVMVVYYIDYTPPSSSSGGGGTIPADYSSAVNTAVNYTYLITPPVDVSGAQKATLSFWTKYWMTQGTNGGIMYLWGSNNINSWEWDKKYRYYLMPTQSYTGNLDPKYFNASWSGNVISSGGPRINDKQSGMADASYTGSGITGLPMWCFNGRSGDGTFGWDYIEVDLTRYLEISNFKYIRIVFMLVQFGGLGPESGWNPAMGWYLDDVKITITGDGQRDLWQLKDFGGTGNEKAHSGNYAWVYGEGNKWALPEGIDSSLITKQIDLTTARSATLNFYIRFNLNSAAGVPPATVRVEISDDNGMTWQSITYGVRIGWGYTGDGRMGGTLDSGGTGYGWVSSSTLARINCDLSGWAGRSILIRFRVATNATDSPTYDDINKPYGVFLDDVVVYGEGYAESIDVRDHYLWES